MPRCSGKSSVGSAESSGFMCSLAGVWAEDMFEREEAEFEIRDGATTSHSIGSAKNGSEEYTIADGRKRGLEATQTFENAWANAKNKQ